MSAELQSFPDNFFCLTGHSPMRWQHRLFHRLLDGKIPTALDLPTGLGKTSVMAIWLLARAFAKEDALKATPRRLVYVVDRRAVVDQATDVAETLRDALDCNDTRESKAEHLKGLQPDEKERVFAALRALKKSLNVGDGGKLPISTLRGAYADNREWLDDPAAPAIIVGTVDMIGSRLLFEGYGVSRKMRPYHAGLLGADTLIVLDEAHLVPPFEALLRRIEFGTNEFGPRTNANDHHALVPPFRLLSLSATGRAQSTSHGSAEDGSFHLEGEDISDPVVIRRLAAGKTLEFVKIDDAKDALVDALSEQAWTALAKSDRPLRCLIYCDSREIAEKVKEKLDKLATPDKKVSQAKADTELFVGARRVKEREDAKTWLQSHGFLAGSGSPAKPAFLIATSAGEVGVDLDADRMVCDLVPWERMVQRLGRVNRRGESDATIAVVHGDEPKPKKPDEPTEQERRQIVGFRSRAVFEELPNAGDGKDASPGALRKLKLRAETDEVLRGKIAAATTPEPLRPALTRPLVDAWSMTALENHTGRPDIAPWLRGWVEEDQPQTTVLWRKYLPVRAGSDDWPSSRREEKEVETFFEAAPPHMSELLETETFRVVEWLIARIQTVLKLAKSKPSQDNNSESESGYDDEPKPEQAGNPGLPPLKPADVIAFALNNADDLRKTYRLNELANGNEKKIKDRLVTELREAVLVVDARLAGLKNGLLKADEQDVPCTADDGGPWTEADGKSVVGFRIRELAGEPHSADDEWEESYRFDVAFSDDEQKVRRLVVEGLNEERRAESRCPQLLADHQSLTELKARRIAQEVGLSGAYTEALATAGRLHDEGKKAENWQRAFNAKRDGVYAKTCGPINQAILDGYRHEFGSLSYVEKDSEFMALPEGWRDLVLHLVAAHHGGARPLISTQGCEDAPPSALEVRARDVALRFARLQKRWGPWGLAWWETLLRAADQQASRDNDRREGTTASQLENV